MAVSYEFDAFILNHFNNGKSYVITATIAGFNKKEKNVWEESCGCDMESLEEPNEFEFEAGDDDDSYELKCIWDDNEFIFEAFKNGEAIPKTNYLVHQRIYKTGPDDAVWDMLEYPKDDENEVGGGVEDD
jgi:hypothetical protein